MPDHITAETHRRETKERLVRIETIVDRMEGHLTRLNDRTRKLEIWRGWLAGAIATMTIIGTIIGVI
jgi:ferritin-like metal-binding protein YciE